MTLKTGNIFSQKLTGAVWRMEIDELTDTLLLELRDTENKQVSFASVELKESRLNFKDLAIEERWLTGVEIAYDGILLLHHYQSDNSPVHKGIVAIHAKKAAQIWSNYNYTFNHLSLSGPVMSDDRFQPRKLFLIDINTGATVATDEASLNLNFESIIVYPEMMMSAVLKLPVMAHGNIAQYADYNNLRIVSLHTLKEAMLQQKLFILIDGAVVFEDLLNDGIQKMQPESFILYKNYLIYLVNRCQIKILTL